MENRANFSESLLRQRKDKSHLNPMYMYQYDAFSFSRPSTKQYTPLLKSSDLILFSGFWNVFIPDSMYALPPLPQIKICRNNNKHPVLLSVGCGNIGKKIIICVFVYFLLFFDSGFAVGKYL